jgi:hypothetical protein
VEEPRDLRLEAEFLLAVQGFLSVRHSKLSSTIGPIGPVDSSRSI